jgi:hypothetical protein
MVSKALHDLNADILKLKKEGTKQSENYRIAEDQSKDFVPDRSFQLMFPRSEHFDVQAATTRRLKCHF